MLGFRGLLGVLLVGCAGLEPGSDGPGGSDTGDTDVQDTGTVSDTDTDDSGDSGDTGTPPEPEAWSCDGVPDAVDLDGLYPTSMGTPVATFEHISLFVPVAGDANGNARAQVRARQPGGAWTSAPDLVYSPGGVAASLSWSARFAGTVFGQTPGSIVELEVLVSDPDGGCLLESATVVMREEPVVDPSWTRTPVGPGSFPGVLAAATPGMVIELSPGNYDGFTTVRDGSPGAPIVIIGGPGVVINGDVRADDRSHVWIVGLTVNGKIKFNNGNDLAILQNTITTDRDGIVMFTYGERITVLDNRVTGPTAWTESALGSSGSNLGEGIVLTGNGHVIAHNRVEGFRDGISFLEDSEAVAQHSIDVLHNDIYVSGDDAIEADFCEHNCRIHGNRITNAFMAVSAQPTLGGPMYITRNVIYNAVYQPFKLQRESQGDQVWHNTVVKSGDGLTVRTDDVFARQVFRNNVVIGGPSEVVNGWNPGSGWVINMRAADATVDLDHNLLGSETGTFEGRFGDLSFATLPEFQVATGFLSVGQVSLEAAFSGLVTLPNALTNHSPVVPLPGAPLVDAGVELPGFNDGFDGAAPDVGAIEAGAVPTWGPR